MVNTKIYGTAALVTLLVVALMFGVNWWMNRQREAELMQTIEELQMTTSEAQLELLYVTQFGHGCDILVTSRETTTAALSDINRQLTQAELNIILPDWEWNRLKAEQTMLYVKLWLLTLQERDSCRSNISTILYFFDTSSAASTTQGYVLDSITNQYGTSRVQVIPLDYNMKLGIVRLLARQFNVTATPSIVLNENEKLEGLVPKATIIGELGLA